MCTVRVFINFLFGRFFCFLQLSLKLCCGLTLPQTEPFAEINLFIFIFYSRKINRNLINFARTRQTNFWVSFRKQILNTHVFVLLPPSIPEYFICLNNLLRIKFVNKNIQILAVKIDRVNVLDL